LSTEQTIAVVLRSIEFSETSLIVTLYTRDFGRISAIAKGARRPKGPFEGALDLLSVCRVVVIRKASDSLDLLTEAKLHRRFRGGERSLPQVYAGYAVAELLRTLTDDDEPHRDVYDLTIATLRQIEHASGIAQTMLYFETQLLRMLGHAPGVESCTDCGGPLSGQASTHPTFSLNAGGLVCDECRSRQQQNIRVSSSVIETLRRISSAAATLPVTVEPRDYPPLRALVSRYTQTVTGVQLRMQAFYPDRILP
jgi:DNA repair protein RecO (recombination protein O)